MKLELQQKVIEALIKEAFGELQFQLIVARGTIAAQEEEITALKNKLTQASLGSKPGAKEGE